MTGVDRPGGCGLRADLDRLGSSPIPRPKPSRIAPNPAVSAPRLESRKAPHTPRNRRFVRVRHAALQAGGRRFDPGWLHGPSELGALPTRPNLTAVGGGAERSDAQRE